jgi:hypothetical protein
MNKLLLLAILSILATLLLAGCNFPGVKQTPVDSEYAIQTAAAKTVEALGTLVAATRPPAPPVPTQGELAPNPQPTVTISSIPTNTLTLPSNQPLPPVNTLPIPTVVPCDRALFIADVTVPDGTTYAPDKNFTKTWRLKNNGSCTWSSAYKLVFDSGDIMGGAASIALTSNVAPGGEIDVSVNFKSPAAGGSYTSSWKLQNASGARFGIGQNGDKAFWVKITVAATDATPAFFAVTSVNNSASPSNYSGACPATITFSASIITSAAGTVTYFWESSDGVKSSTESLTYDSAGSKTVNTTWTLGGSGFTYSGWEKIYIDQPNHQYFYPANFTITCDP